MRCSNRCFVFVLDIPVLISRCYILTDQLQPDQQHAVTKRAIMGALMKKVAGNVVERTMHLKEKVSHFIETTDEEWSGER